MANLYLYNYAYNAHNMEGWCHLVPPQVASLMKGKEESISYNELTIPFSLFRKWARLITKTNLKADSPLR